MKKTYQTPEAVTIDLRFTQPLLSGSPGLMNESADTENGEYIDPLSHEFDSNFEF